MFMHQSIHRLMSSFGHMLLIISTALVMTGMHQWITIFWLGQFDPKFGPAGTLQIALLVTLAMATLVAPGAGISQWLSLHKASHATNLKALNAPVALTISIGVVLLQPLLIDHLPLIQGVSDNAQILVLLPLFGFIGHWVLNASKKLITPVPTKKR